MKKFIILIILLTTQLKAQIINSKNPFTIMNFDKEPYYLNSFGDKASCQNCVAEYVEDIDLHKNGKILSIEYNVTSENSKAGYIINFSGLDLSLFDKFNFKIKGDISKGFDKLIKIEIATWNDKIYYVFNNITEKWQEVSLPINEFSGNLENFNFEGVEKISFVFENVALNTKEGKIFIDDIKLIPKKDTKITLQELKLQKYLKPMNRLKGFPKDIVKNINLNQENKKILFEIAKDTWKFFANVIDKNTYLIMDNITVNKNLKDCKVGDYTNITNIGLQILSIISVYDLGFITEKEAKIMLSNLLKTIKNLKRWNGLFYNYYLTKNGKIANDYISTVDNGWLAAGLIVLRNSFKKAFYKEATEILSEMDFSKLYNSSLGQFHLGYDTAKKSLSQYHYGLLNTEPRIASLIAIGKGNVPKEHYFKIYRTLPKEWTWQRQIPQGSMKEIMGVKFFGGYYTNSGEKFIPSWGGSMFETLMPLIVLDEINLAPNSLGKNDTTIVKLHIKFSEDNGFPYWGFSPCSVPDEMYGGYHEFGIPVLGTKGYEPEGIVTPHAIILAFLAYDENIVMQNLKNLINDHPEIYGEYGLYDSFDIYRNRVTKKYLALDQGMILISLCNFLNKGSIQKKFENDEIIKNIKELISIENFFE
jgi:hypothetical protein